MNNAMKVLGVGICLYSFLGGVVPNPTHWLFNFPVIFALGCMVYGLGRIIERLDAKNDSKPEDPQS